MHRLQFGDKKFKKTYKPHLIVDVNQNFIQRQRGLILSN